MGSSKVRSILVKEVNSWSENDFTSASEKIEAVNKYSKGMVAVVSKNPEERVYSCNYGEL
jgi:hypothetical protein